MSDLYEAIPRPVEVMIWDGTLKNARPVVDWIEGKGVPVDLLKRGDESPNRWDGAKISQPTIVLGNDWIRATKKWCCFVWDPSRDFQFRGDVGIDVYSIEGFNKRFRPRESMRGGTD